MKSLGFFRSLAIFLLLAVVLFSNFQFQKKLTKLELAQSENFQNMRDMVGTLNSNLIGLNGGVDNLPKEAGLISAVGRSEAVNADFMSQLEFLTVEVQTLSSRFERFSDGRDYKRRLSKNSSANQPVTEEQLASAEAIEYQLIGALEQSSWSPAEQGRFLSLMFKLPPEDRKRLQADLSQKIHSGAIRISIDE